MATKENKGLEHLILDPEEPSRYAKHLVRTIIQARDELELLPRDALVHAAWEGIAHYHRQLAIWGETDAVKRFEQEKELRLSLLTEEERERAITIANDWLDENFSQ